MRNTTKHIHKKPKSLLWKKYKLWNCAADKVLLRLLYCPKMSVQSSPLNDIDLLQRKQN